MADNPTSHPIQSVSFIQLVIFIYYRCWDPTNIQLHFQLSSGRNLVPPFQYTQLSMHVLISTYCSRQQHHDPFPQHTMGAQFAHPDQLPVKQQPRTVHTSHHCGPHFRYHLDNYQLSLSLFDSHRNYSCQSRHPQRRAL